MTTRPLLYAYVDETGDRGVSAKSSRYFAMAGLTLAVEDEAEMRDLAARVRQKLSVPQGKALHWKDHVKVYPRRRYVAEQLAALSSACVNYVVFEKAAIPAGSGLYVDHAVFYNYVAGLMMERLLLTAKYWVGGSRNVSVRFGHVKGFNHTVTTDYFEKKRGIDPYWVPWHLLQGSVKFAGMGQYDGLQLADMYAGMLKAAIMPDDFGGYEEHHLLKIRHQIRRVSGRSRGYGFKAMTQAGSLESLPWWPTGGDL